MHNSRGSGFSVPRPNAVHVPQPELFQTFGAEEEVKEPNLCLVCHLRPFLDKKALFSFTPALAISRLDYCYMLYMGLPLQSAQKLQLVKKGRQMNNFWHPKKVPNVTPLLHKLHWVLVCLGVQFQDL